MQNNAIVAAREKLSIYSKLCAETMHDPLASALGRQLCLLIEVKQFHG